MVHSWSSNITNEPQESQGIEIIRSIFHSINVNQHKLPDSLAFSELKPAKSFNKIVNDVSNRLEFNSKAKSKFYYKNNLEKKNIKSRKNLTPVFQQAGYEEPSDTISGGKSNSDESTDPNISSDKINLLWINNPKKFKSSNEKINKNTTQTSVPFNQRRLEEIRQYVEHILTQEDNENFNKSPVRINPSGDEFSFNINADQQNNNEKYHQISLSINNYYQSADSSKNIKNSHEKIEQQGTFKPIKIDRQKTFSCKKEVEIKSFDYKNKNIGKSKDELNMLNNLNSSKYSELIKSKQLKTADDLLDKRRNNLRSNPIKNKLSAVLTGKFKTAAKPSKMLIPQNTRGRALFQSFMHMNDLPEGHEIKSINEKNNKLQSSPENLKSFKLKNRKVSSPVNPTRKSWGSNKISPRYNTFYDSQVLKSPEIKLTKITKAEGGPPAGLLRSKTFVTKKKIDSPVDKKVNSKIETDGITLKRENDNEQINVEDIKSSKYTMILEEILSEEEYSCELIEINKSLKSISNNEINNLMKENLITNNSTMIDKNKEILTKIKDEKNKVKTTVLLKDNKLNKADTFTETEWFRRLSQVDTFTETEFINQLDKINASTETDFIDCERRSTLVDAKTSCDNFMSLMSTDRLSSQLFIDAEVFYNIPIIDTVKEESFAFENLLDHQSYCVVDTQTSETLLLKYFSKEKKDALIETTKLEYQCKNTNTEQVVLIDTATGKDRLDIQNFNCDSQSINTDNHFFGIPSEDSKIMTNDVECQVGKLNCLISIDFDKTSTAASVMSLEQAVSNFSSELILSQKSLLECTSKFSDCDIVSCGSLNNIPTEVIKAFKIATERAQNLYQAYRIYQEYLQNKQESNDNLVENSQEKISPNVTGCEEIKSSYLIKKKISYSGIQEIKLIIENILDLIEEKMINVKDNKLQNYDDQRSTSNSSALLLSSSSSSSSLSINEHANPSMQSIISRKNILLIIYGTLCLFVFWSLQFSAYYEIN